MLFNSFAFVLAFLPLGLAAFYLTLAYRPRLALWPLIGFSLFFYGWWNPAYLLLLGVSIGANYGCGLAIIDARRRGRDAAAGAWLVAGIVFDLGLLAWFKYANFLVDTANVAFDLGWTLETIVLPLAISFFTFQQITFLVDARDGRITTVDPATYVAFVSFFPQLVAGPIVHYQELVPQYARIAAAPGAMLRLMPRNLAVGLAIFAVGLFKKVVLADSVAPFADAPFDAAAAGAGLTIVEAWSGTIAFSFQIYFDFSGYSDMAIGLARMFGVRLPLNFDAPYKAADVISFWRRWHMTLSRFLRDYLYLPLGGNRMGTGRRYLNLMIVMVLGGLWHGAGWTFVAWGALHGTYLAVNHLWRALAGRVACLARLRRTGAWTVVSHALVLLAVAFAWTFFRADDMAAAGRMVTAMGGIGGLVLPDVLAGLAGPLGARVQPATTWTGAGELLWFAVLAFVVLCLPTTQALMARYRPAIEPVAGVAAPGRRRTVAGRTAAALVLAAFLLLVLAEGGTAATLAGFALAGAGLALGLASARPAVPFDWRRSTAWGLWTGAILMASLVYMYVGRGKEFLYFQF